MLEALDIDALPLRQAVMVYLADPFVLFCVAIDLLLLVHIRRNPPDWRRRAEQLSDRPWTLREAETMILAVITVILSGKIIVSGLNELGLIPKAHLEDSLLISQTVLFHLPVIGLIVYLIGRNGLNTRGFLGYPPGAIWSALGRGTLFCLAAFPVVGLASLLQSHILTQAGYVNEPQYVVELFTGPGSLWMKAYLVIVTVITAPVAEEFVFRGIGISAVASRLGTPWAVLLISFAFATIHFNLYSFLPLFTIAIGFSLAYIYTGSLLVAVCMHGVFNALNIIALFFTNQGG